MFEKGIMIEKEIKKGDILSESSHYRVKIFLVVVLFLNTLKVRMK